MDVLHISAECYPAAKVGGLADVVGSLPKYLNRQQMKASVIMPGYDTDWLQNQEFVDCYKGMASLGTNMFNFAIRRLKTDELGFQLYIADIPPQFEGPEIYAASDEKGGVKDELERFLSFQIAVLEWVLQLEQRPDILHCHDHHTALVPFMAGHCHRYKKLRKVPTVLTIHNAEYQGAHDFARGRLLPSFDMDKSSLLDWEGKLNSLAAGIKCAWQISTVSPTYMEELRNHSFGLEWLFKNEKQKSTGILNGVDTEVWDPETDKYLDHHYSITTRTKGKQKNKEKLCSLFDFNVQYPTISFIGRLVHQKGADLLPELIKKVMDKRHKVNFALLGTGDPELQEQFRQMNEQYVGFFDAALNYNEKLAHQMYAGSDFLIMPSRFEPCGLNQMYSMRYGTIPIVRNVGGLKDTVKDLEKPDGYGFVFEDMTVSDARNAVERALKLHKDTPKMAKVRKGIMELDFSWNASAKQYISMYTKLLEKL